MSVVSKEEGLYLAIDSSALFSISYITADGPTTESTRFLPSPLLCYAEARERLRAKQERVPFHEEDAERFKETAYFDLGLYDTFWTSSLPSFEDHDRPKGEVEALGGLRPQTIVICWDRRLLEFDVWEGEMEMLGCTMSYNEVVGVMEKVTGRKILVKESNKEELKEMIREDEGARFYNQARLSIAQGDAKVEPTLNKLAPDVKPWTVEEYLEKHWSGVEIGEAVEAKGNILT
ncbi:hypothetical protein HO133_002951 [Letharia lupina]|uniref:Uncharacterized protein n=1 Tax=Letharia lupina TaxID=560253 RepID=A0A8H6FAA7_9LECA|nr:uncharacterized protein HO133_002951 [Letharia lupina]KAF6220518.1 hypothetical protein HO133_002951 [Letharia lupina]